MKNLRTVATLTSTLLATAAFAAAPAHWSFDAAEGQTYAGSPAAQIVGQVGSVAGRAGNAAAFAENPTGQLVIPFELAALAERGAFTVEVWLRPTAKPANYGNCIDAGAQRGFVLRVNQTGRLALGGGGSWNAVQTPAALPLNRWTHAAVVFEGGQLTLFVGGQKVGQTPLADTSKLGAQVVLGSIDERRKQPDGSMTTVTVKGFSGQLDDLKIHDRALSADEIAQAAR